jgi:UDP-N-acetylglucosamine 2-epimerase (non-hydrolysing)
VLEEFGMQVDMELNISGKLHEKFSQIINRLGGILVQMSEEYGKIPIPYVHGDTLTATTADKAAFLNKFAVVHVEAGIRTFTPNEHFYHRIFTDYMHGEFDWEYYYLQMQNRRIYELGSIEPYPEQFDTRGVEPSTGYFAVPVELYKETLMNEGFLEDRIEVVGNTVADAVRMSCAKIPESHAFDMYPNMRGKKLIFITIHRRENCEVKERFLAIYYGIKKLILEGYPVCFL